MAEFLEEQLARIRRLTDRMTQVSSQTAELSEVIAQERAALRQSPLQEVRDYRTYSGESIRSESSRLSTARESSRRRRRR
jgi:hypothetical protein